MAGIEELLVSIVSKFDDAGFKKLDTSTTKATKATSILSKNLRGLFVGVIGTIGAKEILNASIRLETLRKQFENITGSRGAAEEQLRFIRSESDRLGLSFEKTVGSYRRFMTAGKSQGLSDANIQNIYSGAMDYATANQLRPEETEQLLSAMTNLLVKGQVSARGLTGQLGKVMPEALQLAAKSLGKTDEEFKQLIKDGLSSTTLLTAMGQQLHSDFSEKAIASADTVQGALNRIQNSFNALKASFLNGEGTQELANALNEVANLLKSNEMKTSMDAIAKFIAFALKHIKEIGAIVAIILGNKMLTSAAKGILGAGSGIARGLQTALNLKSLTAGMAFLPRIWEVIRLVFWALNPLSKITLILTAILAISALVGKLWKDKVKKDQEEAKKTQPDIIRLPDGRYVDRNPNSPAFGKIGQGYNQEDIAQLLFNNNKGMPSFNFKQQSEGFNDWLNPTRPEKLLWKSGAIQRNENSIHIGALHITAKTDDPKDFGAAFKFELTKFFDGFSQGSGFTSPRIRF